MKTIGLIAAAALVCCASLPHAPTPAPYELQPGSGDLAYIVRFDPPPLYLAWWDQVEACSGVVRPLVPFDQLRFYSVGTDSSFRDGPTAVYAMYDMARGTVLIASPMLMRGDIVRHEFLHVLTSPTRNVGHPDSVFRGPCNRLVYHADDPA